MDIRCIISGVVGLTIGAAIIGFASFEEIDQEKEKWQKLMVECGCAAYDTQTGEWYKIETAPAPMATPIPEPYLPEKENN